MLAQKAETSTEYALRLALIRLDLMEKCRPVTERLLNEMMAAVKRQAAALKAKDAEIARLAVEVAALRHDLMRYLEIAGNEATESERLRLALELARSAPPRLQ
jgi:recombinational DNA repair ATPase RecF